MEISTGKVNLMLNFAYANISGLTMGGYEDDVLVTETTTKPITFTTAQNGTTKVDGVVRLDVPSGTMIKGLVIKDNNGQLYDDVVLEGAEIGDYTTTQGTYQINIYSVGRGI